MRLAAICRCQSSDINAFRLFMSIPACRAVHVPDYGRILQVLGIGWVVSQCCLCACLSYAANGPAVHLAQTEHRQVLDARPYYNLAAGSNAIAKAIYILVAALPAPWFGFLPCQLRGSSRSPLCKERCRLNSETRILVRRDF
jgi:hypothetical protein